MRRTNTIVIGGGQAGLAMSRSLFDLEIDHVVLERGRIAERWHSERWPGLRLLQPRWQSRLPGWSYRGPEPDGYMSREELIVHLEDYAASFGAPVETGVTVLAVHATAGGYLVETTRGAWSARNVVIATGSCDRPRVPEWASGLPAGIRQVVPARYRHAGELPQGGVLVVGASVTGAQLAAEIHATGRPVTLAVGRHTRLPRTYRGRDILWWLDVTGVLDERAEDVPHLEAARRVPSPQLLGRDDRPRLDLETLQRQGVRLVGRATGVDAGRVRLAPDLAQAVADADARMARQLERIEAFVAARTGRLRDGLGAFGAPDPPPAVPVPPSRALPGSLDLAATGIRTVVWATGYERHYPWLRVPVLDARGEIRHDGGITPAPGLYVLGLPLLRRRKSMQLDGVGADARELAEHLARRTRHPELAVA